MMFLTHAAFALFLSLILEKFTGHFTVGTAIILVAFSLLPDIDIATSTIGRHFKAVNFFMKHRGLTHTIFFAVLCAAVLYAASGSRSVSIAAMIGVLSHLALDAANPSGVRIFWPSKLTIKGPIRSGGYLDMALLALILVLLLFLII